MDRRSYLILVLFLGAFLPCFSDSKEIVADGCSHEDRTRLHRNASPMFHPSSQKLARDLNELSRELTCYHDVFHVDCGDSSIIAVHQAYFTRQRQENHTCQSSSSEHEFIEDNTPITNRSYCYDDVRVSINRRCSGLHNCSFDYSEESERRCSNQDGVLVVLYDCVPVAKINKYCNVKVTAIEGYIMQPGYPKFYPELSDCSWSLSAAEGQTILVQILHLHISAATEITPTVPDHEPNYAMGIGQLNEQITQCEQDSLSVLEGNMKRFSVCGEDLEGLKSVEADASNDLILKFKSAGFLPASGFLAYYKIQGCPDMPAGENSYLVERNGTAAIYACRKDWVFNDTLENTRFLYCIRNHHWSNTLSPCIQIIEEASTFNSVSGTDDQLENMTVSLLNETETTLAPTAKFTEDILIPCIIIAVLILGNSIVIIIVCIVRRRVKEDSIEDDQEEEEVIEEERGENKEPENSEQPKNSNP